MLAVAGLVYYSRYYDHGFNTGDEGSVVLITQRLLAGERPFLDVHLVYGPLWFYPLVLLFKLTGVSFLAARIYFLCLALVTSWLAFLTVRRGTGGFAIPAVIAFAILVVPGTVHKTYVPLIVVANMLALPSWNGTIATRQRRRVFVAGLTAACSFYVRPDIGLIAMLVLVTQLATQTMIRTESRPLRLRRLGRVSWILAGAAGLPTLVLGLHAWAGGFFVGFLQSCVKPIDDVALIFNSLVGTNEDGPAAVGRFLSRVPPTAILEPGAERVFAFLTYAPIVALVTMALAYYGLRPRRGDSPDRVSVDGVPALPGLGLLAYSTFPQFFFSRPDAAHLSQFMPGYLVLVGIWLGNRLFLDEGNLVRTKIPLEVRRRSLRVIPGAFLILHAALYLGFGLQRPETGSIAMAAGRTEPFRGANGVTVRVTPEEAELLQTVTRIIEENTSEDDAVLCFPYCSGFNVIAARRTLARRLYVDDNLPFVEPGWQREMTRRIRSDGPALIIVEDWDVNGTEDSRFANWATQVMEQIESGYTLIEIQDGLSFYALRSSDSVSASPADGSPR